MALADAQNLAIRKLLSKAAFENTLTPGPPLPKSHPSPALVAKLHLECAALYATARSLVKTPGASRASSKPKLKMSLGRDKDRSANAHADDETGEEYMDWVLADMYDRPERWRVVSDHVGSTWRAWKLVPADEVEEYDNTDSDVWADDMDDEEL